MNENSTNKTSSSTLYSKPLAHEYLERKLDDHHHYAIVRNLVSEVGARPGDLLVEIGAGRGRYTDVLLKLEMRVLVFEPDPTLYEYLKEKYHAVEQVTLLNAYADDETLFPSETKIVCGFHVLHHIDIDGLRRLSATLALLKSSNECFSGWFFLEPNPWNPLYALMIASNPAMTFQEERGLWRRQISNYLSRSDWRLSVRHVGFWPPRKLLNRLSIKMSERFSFSVKVNRPYYLYRIYGASWVKSRNED